MSIICRTIGKANNVFSPLRYGINYLIGAIPKILKKCLSFKRESYYKLGIF